MPFWDMADRLLVDAPVTTVAVAAESQWSGWHLCHHLMAELRVTAAAAGAGDSLIVLVQHSLDKVVWHTLITFATVLGTAVVPYAEVKNVHKAADVGWGPYLRVLATPVGGTAEFVISEVLMIGD